MFITHPSIFCRPFMDFDTIINAQQVQMYSDASRNFSLGFGGICQNSWMFMPWDPAFMNKAEPSIAYLELFAVLATVLNWAERFRNKCIVLFCDNEGVVEMINSSTSNCRQCMVLIRILTLHSLY